MGRLSLLSSLLGLLSLHGLIHTQASASDRLFPTSQTRQLLSTAIDLPGECQRPSFIGIVPPSTTSSSDDVKMFTYGGAVMQKPINLYIVWYGTWPESRKQPFRNFIKSLSNGPKRKGPSDPWTVRDWWTATTTGLTSTQALSWDGTNVNKQQTLHNGTLFTVSSKVCLKGEYADAFSQGKALEANIPSLSNFLFDTVRHSLKRNGGPFPEDFPGGHYSVIVSKDVVDKKTNLTLFQATGLSGAHTYTTAIKDKKSSPLVVSFVYEQGKESSYKPPNGDWVLDQTVDTFAHELVESVSNPTDVLSELRPPEPIFGSFLERAWYTNSFRPGFPFVNSENGDLCNFCYGGKTGDVRVDASGAIYNLVGQCGSKFLIQAAFNPMTQKCEPYE